MSSATDINLIDSSSNTAIVRRRNRVRYNLSLIVGIVLITLFLVLFVLEFSKILELTGRVDHGSPVKAIEVPADGNRL